MGDEETATLCMHKCFANMEKAFTHLEETIYSSTEIPTAFLPIYTNKRQSAAKGQHLDTT